MSYCCGDVDCPSCTHGDVVDVTEEALFSEFRAGMYQAMQMLGAPQAMLILMVGSTTRSECILRFNAWMEVGR